MNSLRECLIRGTSTVSLTISPTPTAAAAAASLTAASNVGNGECLQKFEALVAEILEKEKARFFLTGTGAQQAAMKALTSGARPAVGSKPVICVHPTSHLVFLDCLHDAADQIKEFQAAAKLTLPDFDVKTYGKMSEVPQLCHFNDAIEEHKPDVIVIELPQRMNGGGRFPSGTWSRCQNAVELRGSCCTVMEPGCGSFSLIMRFRWRS